MKHLLRIVSLLLPLTATGQSALPPCPTDVSVRWHQCFGTFADKSERYVGEFRNDRYHGQGTYYFSSGATYAGEFRDGLRQMDREMLEMATSFTRKRARIALQVGLPLLVPYMMGALRMAYGVAWKIALVAELLGSTSGLGFLMLRAQGSADLTTVLAACMAIIALFFAGERLLLDPLARRLGGR